MIDLNGIVTPLIVTVLGMLIGGAVTVSIGYIVLREKISGQNSRLDEFDRRLTSQEVKHDALGSRLDSELSKITASLSRIEGYMAAMKEAQ